MGTCIAYGKESFLSKESDTFKILQSIYFAYDVGIISSEEQQNRNVKYFFALGQKKIILNETS